MSWLDARGLHNDVRSRNLAEAVLAKNKKHGRLYHVGFAHGIY